MGLWSTSSKLGRPRLKKRFSLIWAIVVYYIYHFYSQTEIVFLQKLLAALLGKARPCNRNCCYWVGATFRLFFYRVWVFVLWPRGLCRKTAWKTDWTCGAALTCADVVQANWRCGQLMVWTPRCAVILQPGLLQMWNSNVEEYSKWDDFQILFNSEWKLLFSFKRMIIIYITVMLCHVQIIKNRAGGKKYQLCPAPGMCRFINLRNMN